MNKQMSGWNDRQCFQDTLSIPLHGRQPGTWDPLWKPLLVPRPRSNRIQRNYEGLKITAYMHSWDKLWARWYKKPKNPTATSEEKRAFPLHTPTSKRWADDLSHLSGLIPGPAPTLTPHKVQACHCLPTVRKKARETCCLFSLPAATAGAP